MLPLALSNPLTYYQRMTDNNSSTCNGEVCQCPVRQIKLEGRLLSLAGNTVLRHVYSSAEQTAWLRDKWRSRPDAHETRIRDAAITYLESLND